MKHVTILLTISGLLAVSAFAIGADVPASRPAGATVHGTLSASTSLDLQKPDLSRAVVYLASDAALDKVPPPKAPTIITQKDKRFIPDFAIVSCNTTLEFPNEDPFDHNVFSRSKAAPAFDLDRYPKGMSKSRVFSKVGVVQVFCNIHPSMRAMIVVTPNAYFARADANGKFTIDCVPAGKYTLVAWQERCDEQHKDIQVAADGTLEVSMTLKESRQGIMSSEGPNPRQSYGVERGLGVKQEKLNLPVVTDVHPAPSTAPCCDTDAPSK